MMLESFSPQSIPFVARVFLRKKKPENDIGITVKNNQPFCRNTAIKKAIDSDATYTKIILKHPIPPA
jgi:hypothetical protein